MSRNTGISKTMKASRISEVGYIGEDGKLRLPMDRIKAFLAQNRGMRLIAIFDVAEPGSTELQKGYFYKYVVPAVQAARYEQGERMSERAVDQWLVENYPGEKPEMYAARNFTKQQMTDFLDWLKQFAAENLHVYIEDPRTL